MDFFRHLKHFLTPRESNNQRARLLHPTAMASLLVVFTLLQFFLSRIESEFPNILGYAAQIPPEEIVRLTNTERQTRGLPILKLDPELTAAAAKKAADMFAKNYWAHVSPSGTQPWFFITDSGYVYRYAGENLARDFSEPNSVVSAWIASPAHRDNLLSSRYHDIGVAVVDGALNGRDTTLVVQMFGTKLSASSASNVSGRSTVTAAQPETQPNPPQVAAVNSTPVTSAFSTTKVMTLVLLSIFVLVLLVDLVVINFRSITRWTSKSLAHLIFVGILLLTAVTVIRGQIL